MAWSDYEISVREATRANLDSGLAELGTTVEDVRLQGEYPETQVVVTVRHRDDDTNLETRWAQSFKIWGGAWGYGPPPNQAPPGSIGAIIYAHIAEASSVPH